MRFNKEDAMQGIFFGDKNSNFRVFSFPENKKEKIQSSLTIFNYLNSFSIISLGFLKNQLFYFVDNCGNLKIIKYFIFS